MLQREKVFELTFSGEYLFSKILVDANKVYCVEINKRVIVF